MSLIELYKKYNSCLYKYTKSWVGKIPACVTDITKIPNKFVTINEYLNSKKIWKQVLSFISNTEVKDYGDYFDVMFRNWNEIALFMCKDILKRPVASIIFSEKMINFYYKFKNHEEKANELNENKLIKKDEGFYLLEKTMQQDINNLFKLKKINTDLKFHDIISIFRGEFDKKFIEAIKDIPEENINIDNITKMFI